MKKINFHSFKCAKDKKTGKYKFEIRKLDDDLANDCQELAEKYEK